MRASYIEVFETIDGCIEYLSSIGCTLTMDQRRELVRKSVFKYKDTLVLHDPYGILHI